VRFGAKVGLGAGPGGRVMLGDRVEIGSGTIVLALEGAVVTVGDDVFISGACLIVAAESISIGAESMVAEMVTIRDHDHDPDAPPRTGRRLQAPVTIGERCWLGSKSSIVRGGSVADDSVIGAHALVNRPIPPKSLAAGVPARVVRALRRP